VPVGHKKAERKNLLIVCQKYPSCCIPLRGANRLSRIKKNKEKEKEKFSCFVRKTDVFSQTVEQQIAVPERELMRRVN
jgi:hypothetical protein